MPAVGGFVFDSSGAPADREVRVYRRDTGALLGKTRSSGGGGDPHFDKVSLLLPCDGDEGSKLITDSSLEQRPMSVSGAASITKTVTSFGRGCLKFTGSAGAVSTPMDSSLQLGSGDFTVEMRVHITQSAQTSDYPRVIAVGDYQQPGGWNIVYLKPSASLFLDFYGSGTTVLGLSCGAPINGEWNHLAFSRSGTTVRTFLNGVVIATGVSSFDLNSQSNCALGAYDANAGSYLAGYVSDVRITKGIARYTGNFTPPVAALPQTASPGRSMAFGEYYFLTQHTGEVNVVCIDDASAPLENDLILRTFPV